MPWVHDEQAGWHYVRKKEKKETNGTRRLILDENGNWVEDPTPPAGWAPALDVQGAVLGSEGADASGDAGSDPSPRGDRVDPGLGTGPLSQAGEGRDPLPPAEEQRPPEGDAPAPRKPRSAKQLANDQRLREAAAKRHFSRRITT